MAGAQAAAAAVVQELDFLGLEKHSSERRPNFRGIQKAISKMNPEVIKSVIASATVACGAHCVSPPLPLYVGPLSGGSKSEGGEETAPMTIFYNGMVTAFDLPKNQAERILKMAKAESSKNIIAEKVGASSTMPHQGNIFEEVLPISRRKSLERFFEKRKERLMSAYPYEISKGPRGNRS